jgi:hypothetical protein
MSFFLSFLYLVYTNIFMKRIVLKLSGKLEK